MATSKDTQNSINAQDTGGATPNGPGRAVNDPAAPGMGMDTPRSALSTGDTTDGGRAGETALDQTTDLNIDDLDLDLADSVVDRDPGPARDDMGSEPYTARQEDLDHVELNRAELMNRDEDAA